MDLPIREVARIVVLDSKGSILLVRYEQGGSSWWVPPGGSLEPGEDYRAAARRELIEETGITAEIGEELWERRFDFSMPTETVHQIERYYLVRVNEAAPGVHNSSPEDIVEHRWWSDQELGTTAETIYPEGLPESLRKVGRADGSP